MTYRQLRILFVGLSSDLPSILAGCFARLDAPAPENVPSGAAALELLQSNHFDLLIAAPATIDNSFPRQVRGSGSQAPIVILAGDGDERRTGALLCAGATEVWNSRSLTTAEVDRALRYAALSRPSAFEASPSTPAVADELARTLLANFPNGSVYLMDSEGRILLAAGKGLAPIELSANVVTGKSIRQIFGQEPIFHQLQRAFEHAIAGEEALFEGEIRGRYRTVRVVPVREGEGEVTRVLAMTQDITNQRQAEAALRQSELRLARAQAIAHLGYFAMDAEMKSLKWSDELYRILGYEPESFPPSHEFWLSLIHPEDRSWVLLAIEDLVERGIATDHKHRVMRPDGNVRWVHVHNSRVFGADGSVTGYEGTVLDITDVHGLEEEVERFFSLGLDMFCVIGFDGLFKQLNPAWETTLGFRVADLLGRPFLEFVHPDDRERSAAEMVNVSMGKGSRSFENRYRCVDGSYKWMRWSTSVDDAYRKICGVATDITDRRRAEADLLASKVALECANDELEARVGVRTRELEVANRSLREQMLEREMAMGALKEIVGELERAKNEAERANAAKSDFLSRMSHELRTPMNSIMGFAQIMEMKASDAKQSQRVAHILKAGQHLLQLINEVLDLSRVESGRLALSAEVVSAGTIVHNTLDIIRPLAEQKNLAISHGDLQMGSHCVLADPQRLAQVLLNLLSNATKYNREGGSIHVDCEPTAAGKLRISVRDTGPGINSQDLPRLFVPFERLHASETNVEGTGLGLALSKGLVEAMGGSVGAESVADDGSLFWIELPLATSKASAEPELPCKGAPCLTTKQATILYIEDNPTNFRVLEDLLEPQSNIRLIGAMQGSLGLDLARQHHPTMILLDLHLPDMHGEEVLRRLRAETRTRDIPVVILSADATPNSIQRLRESGAREYLTKPVDVHRFLNVVKRILAA